MLHSRSGVDGPQTVHILRGGGGRGGGGGYHIGLAGMVDMGLTGLEVDDDDGPLNWLKDVFFAREPGLLDEMLAKTSHSGGEWR